MPFQSEKQRKYLWANEPAIAKRWEKYPKGYNTGGVSHLFRSKEDRVGFNAGSWRGNPGTDSRKEVRDAWKDFLEYRKKGGDKNWQKYMPIWIGANLAHGGYVRPEEDGVLGLADGGQLVKPGPGRPGYNGWGDKDDTSDRSYGGAETYGGRSEPAGGGTSGGGSNIDVSTHTATGEGGQTYTPTVTTTDDTKTTIDETDDESVVSFNRITGKKMTARDNLIATRFENLVNNKGYYSPEKATNDEKNLYEAFLEATGLGENPPTKINSETIRRVNSVNENTFTNLSRHSSFENLLTGDITREQVLGQGPGEDIKTTTRMMTPQGIWEDGRFIKGLTAPQSWGVQPRNFTRYADGGISQLVKPGPGRPGYGGPQDWGQEERQEGPYGTGDVHVSNEPDTSYQTTTTTPTTTKPTGRNWYGDYDPNNTTQWKEKGLEMDYEGEVTTPVDRGEETAREYYNRVQYLQPLTAQQEVTKKKKIQEKWEKKDDWKTKTWEATKTVAPMVISGITPWGFGKLIYDQHKKKKALIKDIEKDIKKLKDLGAVTHSPHSDTLIQKLEQKILDLTQVRKRKDDEKDDDIPTTISPTISKYPTQEEMMAASLRALEMLYGDRRSAQIPEDRSKQMAYYNAYQNKYMSAKGGRVPGYNTGGLSNLFRLKNK